MGKPITHEYGQDKGILKFFPYLGEARVISATGVQPDANGHKIVPAGTPYPTNDENCLGLLLQAVDVTQGDAPGTIVFEGTVDPEKLTANGITVSAKAKAAMPNVRFYGEPYEAAE